MSKNKQTRICADCKYWKCFEAVDPNHLEDEIGRCKFDNDTVYGDDDYAMICKDFKPGKRNSIRHK